MILIISKARVNIFYSFDKELPEFLEKADNLKFIKY